MLTQLLVAYGAGMIFVIVMETAKVLKARTLSRAALQRAATTAPRFDSTPRVDHPARPAANEPVLLQAAG